MDFKLNTKTGIISAVLFLLYAIVRLSNKETHAFDSLEIYYLAFFVTGFGFLIRNHYLCIAGLAINAVIDFFWALSYINDSDSGVYLLIEFGYVAMNLMLIVVLLPFISDSFYSIKEKMDKLWFVPGVIGFVIIIVTVANNSYFYLGEGKKFIFFELILTAAMFASGYYAYRQDIPQRAFASPSANMSPVPVQGK